MPDHPTRPSRRRLAVALTALAALALTACASTPARDTDRAAAGEGFPVTVEHGQGTAEIPHRPQRVVALSWTDVQIADALDVPLVAAVANPDSEDGNWPGVSLEPDLLSLDSVTPDLEEIASHQPDLILMTAAQPTYSEEYERISKIAPTVSFHTALLQDDGDELTRMIGTATGKAREADALIEASAEEIEAFRRKLPGLAGAKVVFAQYYRGSTGAVVTEDAPVVQFFGRLGLVVPDELSRLAGDAAAYGTVTLSDEKLDLLDSADAALVNAPEGEETFSALPLVRNLRLSGDGTLFFTGNELASLLLTPNPATTGLLLDQLREPLGRLAELRARS